MFNNIYIINILLEYRTNQETKHIYIYIYHFLKCFSYIMLLFYILVYNNKTTMKVKYIHIYYSLKYNVVFL